MLDACFGRILILMLLPMELELQSELAESFFKLPLRTLLISIQLFLIALAY